MVEYFPLFPIQIHPKEGQEFSMEDLVWPMDNGTRKLLLMAKVFWRETMNGPELECGSPSWSIPFELTSHALFSASSALR
jgi:hypothetical protein